MKPRSGEWEPDERNKKKDSVYVFVQLSAVQKETFLITIAIWEGPIAQSGGNI